MLCNWDNNDWRFCMHHSNMARKRMASTYWIKKLIHYFFHRPYAIKFRVNIITYKNTNKSNATTCVRVVLLYSTFVITVLKQFGHFTRHGSGPTGTTVAETIHKIRHYFVQGAFLNSINFFIQCINAHRHISYQLSHLFVEATKYSMPWIQWLTFDMQDLKYFPQSVLMKFGIGHIFSNFIIF